MGSVSAEDRLLGLDHELAPSGGEDLWMGPPLRQEYNREGHARMERKAFHLFVRREHDRLSELLLPKAPSDVSEAQQVETSSTDSESELSSSSSGQGFFHETRNPLEMSQQPLQPAHQQPSQYKSRADIVFPYLLEGQESEEGTANKQGLKQESYEVQPYISSQLSLKDDEFYCSLKGTQEHSYPALPCQNPSSCPAFAVSPYLLQAKE